MTQWTTTALEKVASVFNGKTPAKSEQRGEGHPVLKIRDVDEFGRFRGPFESFVDNDLAEKHAAKKVQQGDTLILNAAHNADYVASKTYCATPPSFGALATGEWLIVRPNDRLLDPGFANHWINTRQTRLQLRELVNGIHLYPKDVARLKISLPVLAEQRRIAAVLDQAETIRTQRRAALALLDSLTQSLFFDMFGDLVTNSHGWPDTLTLGDVADITSGVTKGRKLNGKTTREVPYLAVANVQDKALRLEGIKSIEATENEIVRYQLQKDDLLLTEGGDPDKLGRGTLWKNELPECIHQNHIFRVRLTHGSLDPLFLNWLVGSARGKNYFLRSAKQTTGIASINMTQLRSFPLLIPPLSLQQAFATRIQSIEALKATHHRALASLNALFASLQQQAFAGELNTSLAIDHRVTHRPVHKMEDLLALDATLGLEALIYVAKRTPGNDVYTALKSLYMADKRHLENHGHLIYGETYKAMPLGPVPKAAYEAVEFLRDGQSMFCEFGDSNVRTALKAEGTKRLIPLRDADLSKLGTEAVQSLEAAIRYFANADFGQVKTATHDSAYERTPKNQPIPVQHIIDMLPAEARQRHWNL